MKLLHCVVKNESYLRSLASAVEGGLQVFGILCVIGTFRFYLESFLTLSAIFPPFFPLLFNPGGFFLPPLVGFVSLSACQHTPVDFGWT